MTLSAGTRLGAYEVLALIGSGGMGEVYRARDTKLGRDVAIKILPEALAGDPERITRFEREAKTLAALNHPNIAHIHGLEESNGVRALVMELAEGPTLAERIAKGPIPLDESLPIARQIADALEAAHEQGIIHRDLKPANIKVRDDGTVKALDFGLAKALEPTATSNPNVTQSPTITPRALMTGVGVILGTAAYMSPEQAKGHPADKRSDVWAFGVVFLEMLTGRRVFRGETVSDVLAAVLTSEPDWTALPRETPSSIRTLLRRCVQKDPRRRLASAADARLEIEDVLAPAVADQTFPVNVSRRPLFATATMAVALAVITGLLLVGVRGWRSASTPPRLARFQIQPPSSDPLAISGVERDLALSPDGQSLVYSTGEATGAGGPLMMRAIDQLDAHIVAGVATARQPFFSPDGQWMGFFDGRELKKMLTAGGPAITVCRFAGAGPRGASWADDDTIVFATNDVTTGLLRVPAGGGEVTVLTKPDATQHEADHYFPSVLPGARGVLFTIAPVAPATDTVVAVLDLRTGQRHTLIRGGSQAEYVDGGYLVYAAAGSLRAVRFDVARLQVLGDPVPVVEHVTVKPTGAADYAISRTGTLVYVMGAGRAPLTPRLLVWVDRTGRETPIKAPPRPYNFPRLSPDGTQVALEIRDREIGVWIFDLARETIRRLTFEPAGDTACPVWTPDGRRVVFAATGTGLATLFEQAADGTGSPEQLSANTRPSFPTSVTPDGTRVLGFENTATSNLVSWALPTRASPVVKAVSPTEPLLRTGTDEGNPEVSPDGRMVAYQSNESGRFEIYVRPFPEVNHGRWQVSTEGGTQPAWAKSGRELFFLDGSNTLRVVAVDSSASTLRAGNPTTVFDKHYAQPDNFRTYDVSSDGQRFLMMKNSTSDRTTPSASMVVVLNWLEDLKARVAAK